MCPSRRASCTPPSCRRPSTRVHCARPGVNVRAVLGHSGGRSTTASLPTEQPKTRLPASGEQHRPRRPPALNLLAAFRQRSSAFQRHDGQRRGASYLGTSAGSRERTTASHAPRGDFKLNEASCRARQPVRELLREGQVQGPGRGTLPAEPNPSFEARPNGIALGPRSALLHGALRGPSAIPSVPPQLER